MAPSGLWIDCQQAFRLSHRGERSIPDEGVDLDGVNVVELLQGLLDLSLVGQSVDDEYQGVILLDLLHGALSVERVDDDLVGIEMGLRDDRLAWVLGLTRELEGLGPVEGRRETDLADLVGVNLIHCVSDACGIRTGSER